MSIRIVIFDDNKDIRNSITLLLGTESLFEVAGSFRDAERCVEKIATIRPDVILMDLEMPGIDGVEAIRLLKKEVPEAQILVQTVFEDDSRIYDSIIAGASGYILKNQLSTGLIDAIKDVQSGGSPISPSVARRVLDLMQQGARLKARQKTTVEYHLTAREKEVLTCLVNGLSYKMIAADLHISYETVRSHMKNIYEKLHVASLTEVVAKAIHQNILA
jgi:DNA-binding NarL/FixJ family response regulator